VKGNDRVIFASVTLVISVDSSYCKTCVRQSGAKKRFDRRCSEGFKTGSAAGWSTRRKEAGALKDDAKFAKKQLKRTRTRTTDEDIIVIDLKVL
jgi:hypothetical protein